MLKIRFFRVGKKKQPSFKIVVTDKRRPPSGGRFVEEVGFWNPLTKEKNLKVERIKHWISVGAKPSDSVYNLLLKEKVLDGKKIPLHKKRKKKEKSASAVPTAPAVSAAEKPGAIEAKEEKPKAPEGKEDQPTTGQQKVKKAEKSGKPEKPKEEVKPEEIKEEAKEEKPKESKSEAGEEKPKEKEESKEKSGS